MKEVVKLIGFILIAIGFLGLIINEFAVDFGRAIVITFAAIEVVGFASLAFAHWGMKKT